MTLAKILPSLYLLALGLSFCSISARGAMIQWAAIADAGNTADSRTGYGSVGYDYQIGKYDVTCAQYTEFLNAKDPSGANTLGLYNSGMSTDPHVAGIAYDSDAAAGNKYSVISGQGNKPVTYVSWYSTLRFANWLNNGQGSGDSESGSYTLQGGTPVPSNASTIARSASAGIVLPTENEWYKAAYFKGGATNAGYWFFATQSDTVPLSTAPSPTAANSANYESFTTGYAVSGSLTISDSQNYLTDVGAYGDSAGPYGTFDQAGDVFQWNETLIEPAFRGQRGSSWANCPCMLPVTSRNYIVPILEDPAVGFRVASVPEPSAVVMVSMAMALIFRRRANRR